jgi:hypothetical protein
MRRRIHPNDIEVSGILGACQDGQRIFEVRRTLVEQRQVAERIRILRVCRSERLLANRKGASIKRLTFGGIAGSLVEIGKIVQTRCEIRMPGG